MLSAMLCGGDWSNGVTAGPRAVNLNYYPWDVYTDIGCRLACDLLMYRMGITHTNRYGILRNIRTVVNSILRTVYQIVFLVTFVAELRWLAFCGRPAIFRGYFMQYSDIYNFKTLYTAYLKAGKQKRYRGEVLKFSYNLAGELIAIQDELKNKTYKVGEYRERVIYEPKKRLIVALPFRDKVVQWALYLIIEAAFDNRMIYDSFACRKTKGTHATVKRLSYFMGKENNNYFLKIDMKSYFASIKADKLKPMIDRVITDKDIIWLIDTIIYSSPNDGMPIGNLTSQLFANVYLHELDHYCKNVLAVKYYVRYMDDIVILSSSKSYLKAVLIEIENYIDKNLSLKLNDKTNIGRCKDGIEFVGYRVWRNLKLIKKQSLQRMKKKVSAWKNNKIPDEKFLASLGSWMGHSVNTSSYKGVMRIALGSMREMSRRNTGGF